MEISYRDLAELKKEFGTSFYIFEKNRFTSNFLNYKNTFKKLYPKTEIAYAYKSNYMPILGDCINEYKGMIEVVSDLEYDIALKSIDAKRIIYNGPVKTKENLYGALRRGSIVNIDSIYEIEYIKELLDEDKLTEARIGVRINFKVLHYRSRFGFNIDNGELERALDSIDRDKRIKLISLHSHFSTKEKSLEIFSIRTRQMCHIYKKLCQKYSIEYLDIGGGFFGEMPDELIERFQIKIPSTKEYAETISRVLLEELKDQTLPTLIVEPGISLVGNTMTLYAEILEIKKIEGQNIAVCDTSINVTNPTRSTISPSFQIIKKKNSTVNKKVKYNYSIVGNTCMEHDIIVDNYLGLCEPGDFIMFKNRGAYSNVYTPPFIMPPPAIIGVNGEVYKYKDNAESVLYAYNKGQK